MNNNDCLEYFMNRLHPAHKAAVEEVLKDDLSEDQMNALIEHIERRGDWWQCELRKNQLRRDGIGKEEAEERAALMELY